jgi:hypothetical protein
MTKDVAYRKIFGCTNKDQLKHFGRYVDKIQNKLFNRTKENLNTVTSI